MVCMGEIVSEQDNDSTLTKKERNLVSAGLAYLLSHTAALSQIDAEADRTIVERITKKLGLPYKSLLAVSETLREARRNQA